MPSLLPKPMPSLYQALPSQLDGVRALSVVGNFTFDAATHPDFLGACLGTGMQLQLQVHALHPGSCFEIGYGIALSGGYTSQLCPALPSGSKQSSSDAERLVNGHSVLTLAWLAGIDRGRVGDVLINGEKGAHILVAADIVQYLEDNLTQVCPVNLPLHTSRVTACAVHVACDTRVLANMMTRAE